MNRQPPIDGHHEKGNMSTQKIKATSLVVYTKVSGLARDTLIVLLLGLSHLSDAIFFSMTLIMFFQMVAYYGNVNDLGNNRHVRQFTALVFRWRYLVIGLVFVAAFLLIALMRLFQANEVPLLISFLVCFTLMSPLSFMVGLFSSYGVINGNASAHVRLIAIQNTSLIVGFFAIYHLAEEAYLFLAWLISYLFAFIFAALFYSPDMKKSRTKAFDRNTLLYAYMSPVLMLSIGLVERFFYAHVEGSLGLIKLLGSGAISINFLLGVLFMNVVISKLSDVHHDKREVWHLLKVHFFKAVPVGIAFMSAFVLTLSLLFYFDMLPFEVSEAVGQYFILLNALYLLFFVCMISRDYIERFFFATDSAHVIALTNLFVVVLTIGLNWLCFDWMPISIVAISIFLMMVRIGFLFRRLNLEK